MVFPANATLVFKVPTGGFTVDESTGNRIPSTRSITVIVSLDLKLKLERPSFSSQEIPGANPSEGRLTGRCIQPKLLPAEINVNDQADCMITDPATRRQQTGTYTVTSIMQSRFASITESLGSRIEGIFITAQ